MTTQKIEGTSVVQPYDSAWAVRFKEIKKIVHEVFGAKAVGIEHIGSTSVPGMKAKPVVDALVLVEDMEPFRDEKKKMEELGYKFADDYIAPKSILFYKEDGMRKIENIHLYVKGSFKANSFLDGRDYLRANPEAAKDYGQMKENLQKQFPDDYAAYRSGKHAYLAILDEKARAWREKNPQK